MTNVKSGEDSREPDGLALTIRDLLSYRLHKAANAVSRSAAIRYRAEFDVSLAEWRTIALLGADAPLALNELARAAGLDKAMISRVVTGLVKRGFVSRKLSDEGGRMVDLTLTKRGAQLYQGLIRTATERNKAFLNCLTEAEHQHFNSALNKIGELALAMANPKRKRLRKDTHHGRLRGARVSIR